MKFGITLDLKAIMLNSLEKRKGETRKGGEGEKLERENELEEEG